METYLLLRDREYWETWHDRAVEGVRRFGYRAAEGKLNKWLNEVQ